MVASMQTIVDRLASRLKVRYLVLMVQISKHGSLTRAAEALGFSQPAASKALGELEDIFGSPLFFRSSNGLAPTPLGELALRRAVHMLQDMENWGRETEAILTGHTAHLNVGAIPTVSGRLLSRATQQIYTLHGVTISLHRATSDQLVRLMRRHELDCMIGRATVVNADDNLLQQALYAQRPVLIANIDLARRLQKEKISLHTLASMDWILPSAATPTGKMITEIFAKANIPPPFPKIETYSADVIEDLLQNSTSFLSLMAEDIAVDICRNKKIALIPFQFDERLPPISFIRHNRTTQVLAEENFAETFKEVCNQFYPGTV